MTPLARSILDALRDTDQPEGVTVSQLSIWLDAVPAEIDLALAHLEGRGLARPIAGRWVAIRRPLLSRIAPAFLASGFVVLVVVPALRMAWGF